MEPIWFPFIVRELSGNFPHFYRLIQKCLVRHSIVTKTSNIYCVQFHVTACFVLISITVQRFLCVSYCITISIFDTLKGVVLSGSFWISCSCQDGSLTSALTLNLPVAEFQLKKNNDGFGSTTLPLSVCTWSKSTLSLCSTRVLSSVAAAD